MKKKAYQTHRKAPWKLQFILALANNILNHIGFVELIDSTVDWDSKQCNVSPGNLAKAFILSTFFDLRAPITHISRRFTGVDLEALFGSSVSLSDFNAQAIGRALQRIGAKDPTNIYKTLSLNLFSVYELSFTRLHSDTTSVSFYGDYESLEDGVQEEGEEESLQIVQGYNKDGRHVDNQVVIGKITNEYGIPLVCEVMNGNTSDVEWNKKALEHLADIFSNMECKGVYVADCKLITSELVRIMTDPDKEILFVSRCPASFHKKLENKMIQKALIDNQFVSLGQYGENKKTACKYSACEYVFDFESRYMRAIVAKSTAGTNRYEKKLAKEKASLEQVIKACCKKRFACEDDVFKEWARFCKANNKKQLFILSMEVDEIRTEKQARGKPCKIPKPPTIKIQYYLKINIIGIDEKIRIQFQATEECFVILTNVKKDVHDMAEIIGIYKNQAVVEIEFRYFKEPCLASVIYLKNPDRIKAMLMLLSIALLIRGLIQYKMREGFRKAEGDFPRVGLNGAKLTNPTYKTLFDALQHNYFERRNPSEYEYSFHSDFNELQVTTLLKLMGMSVDELLC